MNSTICRSGIPTLIYEARVCKFVLSRYLVMIVGHELKGTMSEISNETNEVNSLRKEVLGDIGHIIDIWSKIRL